MKRDPIAELRDSRDLSVSVDGFDRAMVSEIGNDALSNATLSEKHSPDWHGFAREMYARLANGDRVERLASTPSTEWSDKLHDLVDRFDEWGSLLREVDYDAFYAAMGADKIARALPEDVKCVPDPTGDVDAAESLPEPMRSEALERLAGAFEAHAKAAKAIDENSDRVRLHVRLALKDAREEIAQSRVALAGLLGSRDDSSPAHVKRAQQLIATNPELKRLLAMAGRLKSSMRTSTAKARSRGRGETIGVELGGDVERLVPMELAYLASGGLRAATAYARMLDESALQYEQERDDTDKRERGPIVFVLDESGSMSGERTTIARASVLAMMSAAAEQRRPFGLVKFSTQTLAVWFEKPWKAEEKLGALDCFENFLNGGTDIGKALTVAQKMIEEGSPNAKQADVVVFSDAHDSEVSGGEHPLTKNGIAKLFVVLVGRDANAGLGLFAGASARTHIPSLNEAQISAALDFAASTK